MGDFSNRYATRTVEEKPPCYGKEEYYDITDSTCRACKFSGTCRIKVKAAQGSRGHTTDAHPERAVGHVVPGRSVPVPSEDPDSGDSFVSVLTYNSGLNAATAMSETLTQALGGIPRKRYPSFSKRSKE
jgi:hypothetical protein